MKANGDWQSRFLLGPETLRILAVVLPLCLLGATGCRRSAEIPGGVATGGEAASGAASGALDSNRVELPYIDHPAPPRTRTDGLVELADHPPVPWKVQPDPLSGKEKAYPVHHPADLALEGTQWAVAPTSPSRFGAIQRGNEIRVMDFSTGKEVKVISHSQPAGTRLRALSPDARYVVKEGSLRKPDPENPSQQIRQVLLQVFADVQPPREFVMSTRAPGTDSPVKYIGFPELDQMLVVMKRTIDEDEVVVLDLSANKVVRRIPTDTSVTSSSYAVTPGGRYLVFQSRPDEIAAYEIASGQCVGRLPVPDCSSTGFCNSEVGVSPDGKRMVSAFGFQEGGKKGLRIVAWDFVSGRQLGSQLAFETSAPSTAQQRELYEAFSLRSWSGNHELYLGPEWHWLEEEQAWLLWGVARIDPESAELLEGGQPAVAAVANPSAPAPASGTSSGRTSGGTPPETIPPDSPPSSATEGLWLAEPDPGLYPSLVGEQEGPEFLLDTDDRLVSSSIPSPVLGVRRAGRNQYSLRVLSVLDGETLGVFPAALKLRGSIPPWRDVSPNGSHVLAHDSREVMVGSLLTDEVVLRERFNPVLAARFASDDRLVLIEQAPSSDKAGHVDLRVRTLALPSQEVASDWTFEAPRGYSIEARYTRPWDVSPGGRYLAFLVADRVQLFDLQTGQPVGATDSLPDVPTQLGNWSCCWLSFSLDGEELALFHEVEASFGSPEVKACRMVTWSMTDGRRVNSFETDPPHEFLQPGLNQDDRPQAVQWARDRSGWLIFHRNYLDRSTGKVVVTLPQLYNPPLPLGQSRWLVPVWNTSHREVRGVTTVDLTPGTEVEPALAAARQRLVEQRAEWMAVNAAARRERDAAVAEAVAAADSTAPDSPVDAASSPVPTWNNLVDPPTARLNPDSQLEAKLEGNVFGVVLPRQGGHCTGVQMQDGVGPVLDARTGEKVGTIPNWRESTKPHDLSADGKYFVARSGHQNKIDGWIIWSTGDGKPVATLKAADNWMDAIAFAGKKIVGWTKDTSARLQIWTLDGRLERTVDIPDPRDLGEESLAISPGGRYAVVATRSALLAYELESGQLVGKLPIKRRHSMVNTTFSCTSLAFSPDGAFLAAEYAFTRDKFFEVWDLTSGKSLVRRKRGLSDATALVWSLDNEFLLGDGNVVVDPRTGARVARLLEDADELRIPLSTATMLELRRSEEDRRNKVLKLTSLPESDLKAGLRVARSAPSENRPPLTPTDHSAIRSLSLAAAPSEPVPWSVQADPGTASARLEFPWRFEVAPVAEYSAFESRGSDLYVLEAAGLSEQASLLRRGMLGPQRTASLRVFPNAKSRGSRGMDLPGDAQLVDISRDGTLVMTAGGTGPYDRLDVWVHEQQQHAISWQPERHPGEAVYYDDLVEWARFVDKRHVLTYAQGTLTLWELPSCRVVYQIRDFGALPAQSPGRRWLATAHADGIRIIECLTGKLVGRLDYARPAFAHIVSRVGWNPDGSELFAVSGQGAYETIEFWDVASGKRTQQFEIPATGAFSITCWGQRYLLVQDKGAPNQWFLIDREQGLPVRRYVLRNVAWMEPANRRVGLLQRADGSTGEIHGFVLPMAAESADLAAGRAPRLQVLGPGDAVDLRVQVDIPTISQVEKMWREKLHNQGWKVEPGSAARLDFQAHERTVSTGLKTQIRGRDITTREIAVSVELRDGAGKVQWQRQRVFRLAPLKPDPGQSELDAALRGMRENFLFWLEHLDVPANLFVPDWREQLPMTHVIPGVTNEADGAK